MFLKKDLLVLPTLFLAACSPQECTLPTGRGADIRLHVSEDLLRRANHGRTVIGPDGSFVLPASVRRIWIDVGAHLLEQTRKNLLEEQDLAVVAVEPLSECWEKWPQTDRLVGLPVALFLTRGSMDFHVNAFNETSSLAESVSGTSIDGLMQTIEIRKVPVLRLEDVIAAIPIQLPIEFLKTDVQGVDLQVLQSAGNHLRRVGRAQVEVVNAKLYKDIDGKRPASEQEMTAFLAQMGFRFVRDFNIDANHRAWLDKEYVNAQCFGGWWTRTWRQLRYY